MQVGRNFKILRFHYHRIAPWNTNLWDGVSKTGSSTITNVLNRYADEHNLTIALPRPGFNRYNSLTQKVLLRNDPTCHG